MQPWTHPPLKTFESSATLSTTGLLRYDGLRPMLTSTTTDSPNGYFDGKVGSGSEGINPMVNYAAAATSTLTVQNVTYAVKHKKAVKQLLQGVDLQARAGEMLAILGPSGAGKTTLLDILSGRKISATASISLNGQNLTAARMRKISTFVEQVDHLLGVLTVRETIRYSLKLQLPLASRKFVEERITRVINALGLQGCQDQRIGTPLTKGISGGQKRRVSVACSMVSFPRIMYLDEPTSGLDSSAAAKVMASIANLARQESLIVIATIHQPGYDTLVSFDRIAMLAGGIKCFDGTLQELDLILHQLNIQVPDYVLPTDLAMKALNTDFEDPIEAESVEGKGVLTAVSLRQAWQACSLSGNPMPSDGPSPGINNTIAKLDQYHASGLKRQLYLIGTLMRRSALNYRRNPLAYGIRVAAYLGMGGMVAAIWTRLGDNANNMDDRLSALFYEIAFSALLSIAGMPSYLEERAIFKKERANGIYGPGAFLVANTLVNLPFLFMVMFLFVTPLYFVLGFNLSASAFFRHLAFVFLAAYAAETQSILVASLLPLFIAALALSAFINGFWMTLSGFFIKVPSMARFWRVSFYRLNFQAYAFKMMGYSELHGRVFECLNQYCPYPTSIGPDQMAGDDVLAALNLDNVKYGKSLGILIGINVVYRLLAYLAIRFNPW